MVIIGSFTVYNISNTFCIAFSTTLYGLWLKVWLILLAKMALTETAWWPKSVANPYIAAVSISKFVTLHPFTSRLDNLLIKSSYLA